MNSLLLLAALACAASASSTSTDRGTVLKTAAAAESVRLYREGLASVNAFAAGRPELFPPVKAGAARLLSADERDEARAAWKALFEYVLALDSLGRRHADWWKRKGADRADALLVFAGAYLASYRAALDFLDRAENEPALHALLDEPAPDTGLPAGSFARFKFRFLNVARAAEFTALQAQLAAFPSASFPALKAAVDEDARRVLTHGVAGRGPELTARNGLKIVQSAGFAAWFPVQTGVSEWMGDTKVLRPGRSLVSAAQIAALTARLEPGDILLERREWYLSNVGLPGYWPHAALYVGTPEQRRAYFGADFEARLSSRAPAAYALSLGAEHGHPFRVVEAISEGVSFTTMEHSADADAVAALRPRLSKTEKAEAVLRAFAYQGRPYDFNFDFGTDAALVCTELVFKCYEPSKERSGLKLPVERMLGRFATPANLVAKLFDQEYGSPSAQLDFVAFLDGSERQGAAVESTVEAFRASWRRPKWHIIVAEPGR